MTFHSKSIIFLNIARCPILINLFWHLYLTYWKPWWGFPSGTVVKNPPANAGDEGSIPGSGRSPGGGNGNPLQNSCLENSTDIRVWWGHKEWDTTEQLNNNHNHDRPAWTARTQDTDDVKCQQGCEAPGALTYCWWECNKVQLHGRQLSSFSQNLTYF